MWLRSIPVLALGVVAISESCEDIFVRWSRVKYSHSPRVSGSYARKDCQEACAKNQHPSAAFQGYSSVPCAGFNHRQGQNSLMHDCELFDDAQLEYIDNSAVADDRYSFYRKLCVESTKSCSSHYQFTFIPDQYMDPNVAVSKTIRSISLEKCLGLCLGGGQSLSFTCRSASFNRTDSTCFLSAQNAQNMPHAYRANNNPNYRIDYYESNCYNNSYAFSHTCTDKGFEVTVDSRYPYTGVMYGLYDYFTCRIEPQNQQQFSFFFPFPDHKSDCTDSINRRRSSNEYVLEVVLSTDNVEPAYYLTADDLTYQATCPILPPKSGGHQISASVEFRPNINILEGSANGGLPKKTQKAPVLPHIDVDSRTLQKKSHSEKEGSRISVKVALPEDEPPKTPRTTKTTTTSTSTTTTSTTTSPTTTTSAPTTSTYPPTTTLATAPPHLNPETTTTPQVAQVVPETFSELYRRILVNATVILNTTTTTTTSRPRPTRIIDRLIASGVIRLDETYRPTRRLTTTPVPTTTTTTSTKTPSTSAPSATTTEFIGAGETTSAGTRLRIVGGRPRTTVQETPDPPPPPPPPRPTPDMSRYWRTSPPATTTTTRPTTTTTTTTQATTTTTRARPTEAITTTTTVAPTTPEALEPILFDIFFQGQQVEAVVVGSRVTLSLTPFFSIPPANMMVVGCQVEPIGDADKVLLWEREQPLVLLSDGCPADDVGLVCPPERTDFGMKISTEAFRYQSTSQIQYTCLVRVCPYGPCPDRQCEAVDGCSVVRRGSFRNRFRRQLPGLIQASQNTGSARLNSLAALLGATGLGNKAPLSDPGLFSTTTIQQQRQLLQLSGDHIVKRRFVIVNDENELSYYIRTGNVPRKPTPRPQGNPFLQQRQNNNANPNNFWGFGR